MSRNSGRTCAVLGCSNSSGKLQIWKKNLCKTHSPLLNEDCACARPYGLHRFPGRAEDQGVRQRWIKNIHRKDFVPNKNSTVCGIHFPDGRPTKEHPYPSLHMGYCKAALSSGRPPPKRRRHEPVTDNTSHDEHEGMDSGAEINVTNLVNPQPLQKCDVGIQCPDTTDHNYCSFKTTKDSATQTDPAPSVSAYDLDDRGSKFFTGLDLGKRFGISRSTACEIFTMWRPVLAKFMREKVIAWLPRDTLKRIRPQCFSENYPKATCIIDCTEIFVQRPKNLRKRSQTYRNYKHHNTYKILYCIAPNGYVMFVSKLFGGRASDTFITKNCGFVDHLIPGDQILADHGFTITDELPPGVTLALPAFTRGCKELPEHQVTETRRLANVRIHVERAIRRLKCFKILSNVIPGRVKHVDDIVSICAGLCNLQPELIRGGNSGRQGLGNR
ncbi:uncharacterized protein LOC133419652 isoform X2 [Cololabis saira]|uniref:uncharacterized protein LOC133419652 isoform X2 n=1 Tax=Cololabis saira TaxID=129043 RepID=UPI002AD1F343|nr:uncharacterized protein LOC133419652 isoform X2 [Cololabis saira]